jgi:hypothetical protein
VRATKRKPSAMLESAEPRAAARGRASIFIMSSPAMTAT